MRRGDPALLLAVLLMGLWCCSAAGQNSQDASAPANQSPARQVNPGDLDLEQLAQQDIKVTSVSKKEESLSGAPAAVYVVTSEDIARGGFSALPDVLRMVPGLSVVQVNAHAWIVSARGFDGFPNEKMLVLIDGRSVYTPLYGGVSWDVQEIPLNEIDRIEVIRGPGGTLWGENAINGVINIITKSTELTQGGFITSSYGHDEGDQAGVRYGGRVGDNLSYRVYGSAAYWEPFVDNSGNPLYNHWDLVQGGTRVDWKASPSDALTVEMRGYDGTVEDTGSVITPPTQTIVNDRYPIRGEDIVTHWVHTFAGGASLSVLAYCDWTDRGDIAFDAESRNTCDVETQHNFKIRPHHSLIWGAEFRTTGDQTRVTFYNHFTPPGYRENLFSVFGQYEWDAIPDRLKIIAGVKLGHNPYTGFETQPQIRAVWTPHKGHDVWGAVSRAVRIPTRNENQNFLIVQPLPGPGPIPAYLAILGNPDVESTVLYAYELGYRFQPARSFSLDVAAFYNDYKDVLFPTASSQPPIFNQNPPFIAIPLTFSNGLVAQTHGLEVGAHLSPWRFWMLSLAVTEDRGTSLAVSSTPLHQFNIQSRLNLPHHFNFDSALYHYNSLAANILGGTSPSVPTQNRVDTGISWHSPHGLTLDLWGRNLQRSRHEEGIPGLGAFAESGEVRRSIMLRVSWNFSGEKMPAK